MVSVVCFKEMSCLSKHRFPFRLQQWSMGVCVKERGEERYCWRAGVMSRDEGGEEEGLLV